LVGVTHAIRTVILAREVAVRDCENHAILLDDWKVDDLPRKVDETCGRHCRAGVARQALRMRFGSYQDAKVTFMESHEGGYNNIPSLVEFGDEFAEGGIIVRADHVRRRLEVI
jgi:hypothetical protein